MKTNLIISIFRINITVIANSFIYYLKKLPFLRRIIPDKIYGQIAFKKKLTMLFVIISYLFMFLRKIIYIAAVTIVPLVLFFDELPSNSHIYFTQIFFGMSLVIGPLMMSTTLQNNKQKYINIKLMRMNHKEYAIASMVIKHVFDFVLFIPAIIIGIIIVGGSLEKMIWLIPQLLFARLIGEAILLFVFDKTKLNIYKKNVLWISISIILLALTYLSVAFQIDVRLYKVLTSWYTNIISLLLAVVAIRYLLKYPRYRYAIENAIEINELNVNTSDILFNDVKIKDDEFKGKDLSIGKYADKSGYDYLNSIFYDRHKGLMVKPIMIVLLIIAVAFVGGLIAIMITGYSNMDIMSIVVRIFPFTIFLMYYISNGAKSTKAMFYNCDVSLLNYSFYRKREALLQNFLIRLKMLIKLNLMPSLSISISIYIITSIISGNWLEYRLLPYMITINLLAIFFSVHYILVYYLFQPYSSSYEIKSPIYNVINFVMYALCFSTLYIRNTPPYFVLIVAGVLIGYIVIATALIVKVAPKTFRLK